MAMTRRNRRAGTRRNRRANGNGVNVSANGPTNGSTTNAANNWLGGRRRGTRKQRKQRKQRKH
jgi:hypothetical protein